MKGLLDGSWQYEYTLTDHLGNGRVYFTDSDEDGTPEVLQENHYYPFGMTIAPLSQSPENGKNKYQYNGKEHHADLGLHWTDYGARWYDAQLGRWHSVDPLADHRNQYHHSPFSYAWNNPIKLTDPDGRCPNCGTAAIGGGVGVVLGGVVSIGTQLWQGENINWGTVAKDAAAGGVTGLVVGSGAGVVAYLGGSGAIASGAGQGMVMIGTGVASGIAGETTSQLLDIADGTENSIDVPDIMESATINGGLNAGTGLIGTALKQPITNAAKEFFTNKASKETIRATQKVAGKQAKQSGYSKSDIRKVRSNAKQQTITSKAQSAAQKVDVVTRTAILSTGTGIKKATSPLFKKED